MLVKTENIQILDHVSDWKEAIHIAAKPLIGGGYIEPRYVDAIFKSTEKFGPYYVLAPEIAMPHASSEDGVIAKQISLLVLKNSIKFSEDGYDVRLIFVLATPDSHSHLQMLRDLSEVFSDEEKIQQIINSDNPHDISTLLNNFERRGE